MVDPRGAGAAQRPKRVWIPLLLLVAVWSTGCGSDGILSGSVNTLSGITTSSRPDGTAIRMQLREVQFGESSDQSPEYTIRISEGTRVFRWERGQTLTRISRSEIPLEHVVQVWHDGVEYRIGMVEARQVIVFAGGVPGH